MDYTRQTFVFTVTLRHIAPPIWRRVEVPATYTFWDLHVAIQDAMGWDDHHLHRFELRDRSTGAPTNVGIPDPHDPVIARRDLPGWEVPIIRYLQHAAFQVNYTYDFGDNWEHHVVLETTGIRDDSVSYPRCLGGERACPPEDCGGPPGYEQLLLALADPAHPRADELRRWAGKSFEPEAFEPSRVTFADPAVRWRKAFRQ